MMAGVYPKDYLSTLPKFIVSSVEKKKKKSGVIIISKNSRTEDFTTSQWGMVISF